jgi:hypothetical protein
MLSDVSSIFSGQRDVVIGIGRSAVFLKTVSLPRAAAEDLRRLVSLQVAQMFPLPPDQLAFDAYQTTTRTSEGWLTVVVAVPADDLRLLNSELKRANLKAVRILPVSFGSMAVAARAGVKDGVVMETTPYGLALDVIEDGVLRFSRLAPLESDAAREARRSLLAFGIEEGRLVTTGGASVPGALSQTETALAVLHEAPPVHLELAEERLRVANQRTAVYTRVALLLMLASFLFVGLVWLNRSDAQAAVTRKQGAWTRELNKLHSVRDAEAAKAQAAESIDTTLHQAFVSGQPVSDITKVIEDQLPRTSWLTTLTVERGKPLQIHAITTVPSDVAIFLQSLSATGRFRDVKLVFANSGKISETPVVQYSVNAVAIGNLPMPVPEKKTQQRTNSTASASAKSTEQKDSLSQ